MAVFIKSKWNSLISDTKFSEILTGSTWALSAQVTATCLALISNVVIAQVYGAEALGIVAIIDSFFILTTIFTVMGTNTSILRLIPEHLIKYSPTSAFKIYRKTSCMVICASLVAGALFFYCSDLISSKIFSKPHLSYYFSVAAAFIICKSLVIFNSQVIRGIRTIRLFTFIIILPHGLNLLLLIIFGFFGQTNDVPIYAFFGSLALTCIAGWIIIEYKFIKMMKCQDTIQPMSIKEIISISLPMLMTATMAFVIGQTGVIMLGMFRSETEVGYYAIIVKLATLTVFILNAVNSMAAPKFSELFHSNNMAELLYVAKRSAKLIFWTTAPILIGLVVYGKFVLRVFFGPEFVVGYTALMLLTFGQFINAISGSTGVFMNMTGHQNAYRNIVFCAAIMNVSLNLILIPSFGMFGAAFTGMGSLIFVNIATLIFIKSQYKVIIGYLPCLRMP